ncbi:MAG: hypothetical protein HQL80_08730 [Magnetococcales bacterium]|nr:hypothetical protein [Magnetococcales bacterium]
MTSIVSHFPGMRRCGAALLLIVACMLPTATRAAEGDETRVATFHKEAKGVKDDLQLTFPINGGAVHGVYRWETKMTGEYISGIKISGEFKIEGRFAGGDGGVVSGHFVNKDGERSAFAGKLLGSGQGSIKHGGATYPLRFPPFTGGCNDDLNSYGQAARTIIGNVLLEKASKTLYDRLVSGLENSLSATLRKLQEWRVDPAKYHLSSLTEGGRYGSKLPPDLLDQFQKSFENSRLNVDPPAGVMLRSVVDNIGRGLSVLQVADAASSGAYKEAAQVAAIEAIGTYSNAAGIALVIAQAAKEDWDAFAERVHEQQFRKFYTEFYFQGTRLPSEARGRMAQRERLRLFMSEAIERLNLGGSYGAPFRRMLVDFAYYRLERSMTLADFDTTEKNEQPVLKHKPAAMVLAALFNAYEEIYWKDLDAERTRRIAERQAREQRRLMVEVDQALSKAANGNFLAVWGDKLYHETVCQVVADLRSRNLLQEADQ